MTNEAKNAQKTRRLPRFCIGVYLLTAVSALLYFIFTKSPDFSDRFNRSISQTVRRLLAALTSWLPFSLAELLLLLLPLLIGVAIAIGTKRYCDSNRSLLIYVGILLSVICICSILFVWGFAPGYYGSTLDQKLGLSREKCSAEELYQTATILSSELNAVSEEIVFLEDGSSLMPYSYEEMNRKLIKAYESFCEKNGFMGTFPSKTKPVMLSEPLSYTHITGIYTFFTGEANLNVNFPDYTLPFTAAHELAHQRGIAREDEANFVAFLVCMESDDPYIRYSGLLNVYEYVISALASADRALYRTSYESLPTEIKNEEKAYAEFFEKYRENVAADISEATNNSYLQSQGATEGTRSYHMVVDLAVAYYRNASD